MFQQDIYNARRWLSLDDQPSVQFAGRRLNDYELAWPYPIDVRPPVNTELPRSLAPLPDDVTVTTRQIGSGGCCARPWWNPTDSNFYYVIDGSENTRSNVFQYTADSSLAPTVIEEAPPMLLSPDGSYQVTRVGGQVTIRRLADGTEWSIQTQGFLPAVNQDNTQLLWEVWKGSYTPGETAQTVETWVSDLNGENARMVWRQPGGWAVWLDVHRLMVVTSPTDTTLTILSVYDTRDGSNYELGRWNSLRNLTVAPGGGRLMFYLAFQEDMSADGIYTIETAPEAEAEKLPFFGGWRWRDADSVFYIPYDITTPEHTLAYYHIPSGTDRYLTDPRTTSIQIADNDWAVSPDGLHIAYRDARDKNLWLLAIEWGIP
jgi:hypothetical protein